ncbi:MAG: amino acid aminotransferase [Pseudomonadota bacterium]
MFESLKLALPDKIMEVIQRFRSDKRESKMDLGAGVYLNEQGISPIMKAVSLAQEKILEQEKSKAYIGVRGDFEFCDLISKLALGKTLLDSSRFATIQTTGGSAALRVLSDFIAFAKPEVTVWVSDPTWPNHLPILNAAQLKIKQYPYFDAQTRQVKFDKMMTYLNQHTKPEDVILLHASCHNPTGANLSESMWVELMELICQKKLVPFFDNAYQGFGDGLETDAMAIRMMAEQVDEMLIAGSCSKNFGLYRERIGYGLIKAKTQNQAKNALSQLLSITRANYSMPPNFGAAIVREILNDQQLKTIWQDELSAMRDRMLDLRVALAQKLRQSTNSSCFDFLEHHRGMFSQTGIGEKNVERLASDYGIYLVGMGRLNIAGLSFNKIDYLAQAITELTKSNLSSSCAKFA